MTIFICYVINKTQQIYNTAWRWKCGGNHGYENAKAIYVQASLGELMRQLQSQNNIEDAKVINKAIGVILDAM